MTVKELIRQLVDYNQDYEVMVSGEGSRVKIDGADVIDTDESLGNLYDNRFRGVYLKINL